MAGKSLLVCPLFVQWVSIHPGDIPQNSAVWSELTAHSEWMRRGVTGDVCHSEILWLRVLVRSFLIGWTFPHWKGSWLLSIRLAHMILRRMYQSWPRHDQLKSCSPRLYISIGTTTTLYLLIYTYILLTCLRIWTKRKKKNMFASADMYHQNHASSSPWTPPTSLCSSMGRTYPITPWALLLRRPTCP